AHLDDALKDGAGVLEIAEEIVVTDLKTPHAVAVMKLQFLQNALHGPRADTVAHDVGDGTERALMRAAPAGNDLHLVHVAIEGIVAIARPWEFVEISISDGTRPGQDLVAAAIMNAGNLRGILPLAETFHEKFTLAGAGEVRLRALPKHFRPHRRDMGSPE